MDSLIAEGGVKSRDLSWVIYILGVIGMQLNFMAIPISIFCAHLDSDGGRAEGHSSQPKLYDRTPDPKENDTPRTR